METNKITKVAKVIEYNFYKKNSSNGGYLSIADTFAGPDRLLRLCCKMTQDSGRLKSQSQEHFSMQVPKCLVLREVSSCCLAVVTGRSVISFYMKTATSLA